MSKPDILIVDDRVENLIALEALLEECNSEVHKASSGNEALAILLEQEFALVLLDVQMPGMDGYEVAELMRLNDKTRSIPIIFVSAISKEQRHVFKGYEVGAVDFLAKPIEPLVLRGKVNIFLDLWLQRRELEVILAEKVEILIEKERLEVKLREQAEFDMLTRLPNRLLFQDRLQQAILMSERHNKIGALIFIDLDRFKWVNDNLGHDAGDQLLIKAAERLTTCVRKSDTVARLGGDEFTVVLQDVQHMTMVENIANKILEELAKPFYVAEKNAYVSGSVGIAIFPNDSRNMDGLLKQADAAMYQAKMSGRNAFRFFTPEMNAHTQKRMALEERLRTALECKEFCLHYQPKVDLASGRIKGMEALIRWESPEEGLIPPDDFIPLAEEIGLIIPLSQWVLETACIQNQKWIDAGFQPIRMSVNISAKHFSEKDHLLQTVQQALLNTGMTAEHLELEITESTVMGNIDIGLKILEALRQMGVHVSVDDFGTGYSSLSSLKQFPIQTLKIDKSFIRDLSVDSNDAAIVSAIISMAGKLSLSVIAEGVETLEQLEFLKKEACNQMQGYYFSRPLTAEMCTDMLKEEKSLTMVENNTIKSIK
jgi:diguanylate cyclase (GGDEF)-like protein